MKIYLKNAQIIVQNKNWILFNYYNCNLTIIHILHFKSE